MIGRISRTVSNTWGLMKSSFSVLKKEKELLLFTLFSGISCIIVITSFFFSILDPADEQPAIADHSLWYFTFLFLFYFCLYFVIVFFNTAIVACVVKRIRGGNPTLTYGLRTVFERLHYILGWTLVTSTVGVLLRGLEDSYGIENLLFYSIEVIWSLVAFLAVPILTVEKVGPLQALSRSAELLKKTWGEQIIGEFSFDVMFLVLSIPSVLVLLAGMIIGISSANLMVFYFALGLAVLYFGVVTLVEATLHGIFRAVVYVYARDHDLPDEFSEDQMQGMIRKR